MRVDSGRSRNKVYGKACSATGMFPHRCRNHKRQLGKWVKQDVIRGCVLLPSVFFLVSVHYSDGVGVYFHVCIHYVYILYIFPMCVSIYLYIFLLLYFYLFIIIYNFLHTVACHIIRMSLFRMARVMKNM